jgi:hypothetical protein
VAPPPAGGATCFAAVWTCDQSILRLDAYPEFAASGCDVQLAFHASAVLTFFQRRHQVLIFY